MNVRMIDADALKAKIRDTEADGTIGNYCKRVMAECLDNDAPTIPAIPVAWLKAQRDKRRAAAAAHSNISSMTVLEAINVVLELWQKGGTT